MLPSYEEPSFSGSQLLPVGFVESVLNQLHRDESQPGVSQPVHGLLNIDDLAAAVGQEPAGPPRAAGARVMPPAPGGAVPMPIVPVAAGPAPTNVQRVPPGRSESGLSEDELNVLRARSSHAGAELSSPQAVPAIAPRRVVLPSNVSDQDVPGTESASSSSGDYLIVPGSVARGSRRLKEGVGPGGVARRLKEGVVPSVTSKRLKWLKHMAELSTRVRCST